MKKLLVILLSIVFFSCSSQKKQNEVPKLYVFAAASLADVITEITDSFKVEHSVDIKLNLAASGTLARQIEQGAQADVYLSANKSWMDYLSEKEMAQNTAVFTANELALISAADDSVNVTDISWLLKNTEKKIAIGDPGYVPAGKYAQQVFDFYDLDLTHKLFQTTDVRSALMMVEMGEAGYGIVYKTDAIQSGKVNIVYAFPKETHSQIQYFQVLISENQQAKEFYDYLYSPIVKKILEKYQFKVD